MPRGNIANFKGKRQLAQKPICHPERKHYAKTYCRSCYDKTFRNKHHKQLRKNGFCIKCERFGEIASKDMCQTCYQVVKRENFKIGLLIEQGNKCAIRGCQTDTSRYQLSDWCLDHDHQCCTSNLNGCIKCRRGVLCRQCNSLLGMAKDSVERLTGAIEYLERNR